MAPTRKHILAFLALAVLLAVAVRFGITAVRRLFPGSFDRAQLEAIVAEVRRVPIAPGEQVTLRVADLGAPRSLRPAGDEPLRRGAGAGLVWAERTREGKLKVVIETSDRGHAGEYGFAFSEVPLEATPLTPGDTNWSRLDVPGRLYLLDERIDEHWWAVLYNLD